MKYNSSIYNNCYAVTNRKLYGENYFCVLSKIVELKPAGIILREKDINNNTYLEFAKKSYEICTTNNTKLIIHSHYEIAKELGIVNIHLPFSTFMEQRNELDSFEMISVSCHSSKEAIVAQKNGATQIVLGTIFETQCKPGLTGKGINFLKHVVDNTDIPIYAIGGVDERNINEILDVGAKGGCMMSGFLKNIQI